MRFLYILFITLFLNSCSIGYISKVSYVQAKILLTKKDIKDNQNKELEKKLALVLKSREYAENIGLTPKESYLSYSDRKDIPQIFVVSAAEKDKLKPKTWWYPFVGDIPYKGYFTKEEAEEEASELEKNGFDTSIRTTSAYSTLGWFNDPILPSTLSLPDQYLVNTVIHEITHGTFWKPNFVSFNETSSNTIGHIGSVLLLKNLDTDLYQQAKKSLVYECLTSIHFKNTKDSLTLLFEDTTENKKIDLEKKRIYDQLKEDLEKTKEQVFGIKSQSNNNSTLNNSTFLSTYIYLDGFIQMIELYNINQDIKSYIKELKTISELENPYEEINKKIFNSGRNIENKEVCESLNNL